MTTLLTCAPGYRRALIGALGLTLLSPIVGFVHTAGAAEASLNTALYPAADVSRIGVIAALGGLALGYALGGLRRRGRA